MTPSLDDHFAEVQRYIIIIIIFSPLTPCRGFCCRATTKPCQKTLRICGRDVPCALFPASPKPKETDGASSHGQLAVNGRHGWRPGVYTPTTFT